MDKVLAATKEHVRAQIEGCGACAKQLQLQVVVGEWIRLTPPEEAPDDFWHEYLHEPDSHTICEVDPINAKAHRSGTHAVYLSDAELDALSRHAPEVRAREEQVEALRKASRDMFGMMCQGWPAQQAEGSEADVFNAMRTALANIKEDFDG